MQSHLITVCYYRNFGLSGLHPHHNPPSLRKSAQALGFGKKAGLFVQPGVKLAFAPIGIGELNLPGTEPVDTHRICGDRSLN
jgi:hypothetical protein